MTDKIKEYSTAWLKEEIRLANELMQTKNAELALHFFVCDMERYIEHISKNANKKGRGTSTLKAATSAANGAKGGRPKGSKNKTKKEAL